MYTDDKFLMHYGVKGMKWGVRHDKPSLGRRYSSWGRSVSNAMYDKQSSIIEQRRQKRADENFLRNTRYGKAVDRISNKNYDRAQKRISERRSKKNQEFDSFDRMLDKREKKKKAKTVAKNKKTEERKALASKIRNYTGSHTSDALKQSRRKDINKMSNQELQSDITRLRLEREYRSLTRIDTSFGRQYVNEYNNYNSSFRTLAASTAGKKSIGYGKRAVEAMRRASKAATMV